MASHFDGARQVIRAAIAERVFPAAVVNVGAGAGVLWQEPFGTLTFVDPAPTATSTPFDLASLTKVIATTSLVMEHVGTGSVRLEQPIAASFSEWRGADREAVTVRDLLEHASGLPARLVDAAPMGPREFEHDICTMPLEYAPRTQSVYSDLGFILLGLLVSARGRGSLGDQFERARKRFAQVESDLAAEPLSLGLAASMKSRAAPTLPGGDDPRRGRMLMGDVHDLYAARLGEVAGHAGLFGTAAAVAAFARVVLRALRGDEGIPGPLAPALVRRFVTKSGVPGSSRALGWDTMLATSSCGRHLSAAAIGHVGFTGTSLWIDPERNRYFVLLTNRACGGGTLEQMRIVRRSFHDALTDL